METIYLRKFGRRERGQTREELEHLFHKLKEAPNLSVDMHGALVLAEKERDFFNRASIALGGLFGAAYVFCPLIRRQALPYRLMLAAVPGGLVYWVIRDMNARLFSMHLESVYQQYVVWNGLHPKALII
mgnify:CR=1 FL=1